MSIELEPETIAVVDTEHFPQPDDVWAEEHRDHVIKILKERNEIDDAQYLELKSVDLSTFRDMVEVIEERIWSARSQEDYESES